MKNLVNFPIYNLSGGIDYLHSEVTIEQSKSKCAWFDAQNVEIDKTGKLVKAKGNVLLGQLTNKKILGIHDYYHKSGQHFCLINASDGKLYNFDVNNGTFTELYSGFDINSKCTYANAFDGCVVNDGVNDPVFYEYEEEIQQCETPLTHRGKPLCLHKGRLFIKTISGLAFSALGKYNDWTTEQDAGVIEDVWNDYSEVTALKSYGEYLVIHKKSGYAYLLSGNDPASFAVTPFGDRAAVSQFSVANGLNMQLYYSKNKAIYPLVHNSLGQIRIEDEISLLISKDFANIDLSQEEDITIIEHPTKSQIWFFMPYNFYNDLSYCWILQKIEQNTKKNNNYAWIKRKGSPVTYAAVYDKSILTGTADGKILKEDEGNSFDGKPILSFWDSPWFHFSIPTFMKSADKLIFSCSGERINKFNYSFRKNYDAGNSSPLKKFNLLNSNVAIYDQNYLWDSGVVYADQQPLKNKKIKIPGKFLSLQLHLETIEEDDDFSIIGLEFTDIILEE